MNYTALIHNRKSVRAFSEKEVPLSVAADIIAFHDSAVKRLVPDIATELYVFNGDVREALEDAAGYHKYLVGSPQYLVLLSEEHEHAALNAGYIMEDMVLKLMDMELESCWVTFTDSELIKESLDLESPLAVAAIVAFGYGKKTPKRIRLNIKSMSDVDVVAKHRYMDPKRSLDELVYLNTWGNGEGMREHIGFYDDMLYEAFYAASLSPSYLNRQAYGFLLHDGALSLISRPDDYTTRHDGELSLGIALLHFSAVLGGFIGKLNWALGSEAAKLSLPEGHKAVATLRL